MRVFEQNPHTGDYQLRDYESGEVVTSFLDPEDDEPRPKRSARWRTFDGSPRQFDFDV